MTKQVISGESVTAFKMFDPDLKCRGFQYEVGETYKLKGDADPCRNGFHACPSPLACFDYYPPSTSRYAVVEARGAVERDDKIASAEITIKAELSLHEFINRAVEYIVNLATDKESNTGNYSAASNTGDQSAASNTGYQSAASNTGNYSAASNTGNYSAASVEGLHSVAVATGYKSKAKASLGSAIFLVERNEDMEIVSVFSGITKKRGKLKADTWYTLVDGKPSEVA